MGINTLLGDSSNMPSSSAEHDPRYENAMTDLNSGNWNRAAESLQGLLQEYPQDRERLTPLLTSARLKASVGTRRIRGRSSIATWFNRRRRAQLLVFVMLITLALVALYGYRSWLAPLRADQQLTQEIETRMSQAYTAMAANDYDEAERLFTTVLALDPVSESAQSGLNEVHFQQKLRDDYIQATQFEATGQIDVALETYAALEGQSPGYRDVAQRVQNITALQSSESLFLQAQEAYTQGRWDEAISLYTSLRERNVTYRQNVVETQLYESLMQAANRDAVVSGQSNAQIEQTIERYRRALALKPGDIVAQARVEMLTALLQGKGLIGQGRVAQAEQIFTNIYAADPGLLGVDLVQLLFNSRMALGNQYEIAGNLWPALRAFQAAATLPVPQAGEAQNRAAIVTLALTPTVTPTFTPEPTPTPDPLAILFAQLTPEAPAAPLGNFVGWIAFRSDRPGSPSGLWVMREDGSDVQPVSDPGGFYLHLKKQALWRKDESARFWVESDGSAETVAIYMWRYDLPPYWLDARTEVLNNSATNYEAQLSPNERYIAFTSQRSGAPGDAVNYGDEIFILDLQETVGDGYHVGRRLTWNDWQWDKHPTFSADSRTIFFWSNRDTGNSQIWAMNLDGSNQRNVSNSEYNDWDPVLVSPYRELPTHEALIAAWEEKLRTGN